VHGVCVCGGGGSESLNREREFSAGTTRMHRPSDRITYNAQYVTFDIPPTPPQRIVKRIRAKLCGSFITCSTPRGPQKSAVNAMSPVAHANPAVTTAGSVRLTLASVKHETQMIL
jgi:hypothetical protein